MTVRHPAISGNFPDVMDVDTWACVVLRIRGHAAVRYLVLLGAGERGERRVVPERLLCVPRPIGRVLAQRDESEVLIHIRHPGAKVMAANNLACSSKRTHDAARAMQLSIRGKTGYRAPLGRRMVSRSGARLAARSPGYTTRGTPRAAALWSTSSSVYS